MKIFLKRILLASLLVFATQTFAAMSCEGTVYLKLPEGWKSAYAVAAGQRVQFVASEKYPSWMEVSVSSIGGINEAVGFNINETGEVACFESGHCITPLHMDSAYMMLSERTGFTCADFSKTGELWISANPDPDKPTVPYVGSTPPDVKVFYVFLPNTKEWKGAVPMLSVGGKPGEPMNVDPNRCGWYYKRYVDEKVPTSVLIYRDDDETMAEAIGLNGNWEKSEKTFPIDLDLMFSIFDSESLYFVADENFTVFVGAENQGWSTVDPVDVVGDCGFNLSALIYDTDASLHGAFTCAPEWFMGQLPGEESANACYYSTAKYNVVSSATAEVPCIGVTQGMVTDELGADKKLALTATGKRCFGSQPDEAFTAMFNSTKGINETSCFEIPLSKNTNDLFEFNSDYYQWAGAMVPGGFYPAEVEPSADVLLSDRLPVAESKRKAEGPVFMCAEYNNLKSTTPEGLRTIDAKEGVPVSNLICNGPGWDGGIDCGGLFASGSEFSDGSSLTSSGRQIAQALGVSWEGDGWGWSCPNEAPIGWTYYKEGTETVVGALTTKGLSPAGTPRWTSGTSDSDVLSVGGRNQHFCIESHAKFRYKKGLRFAFVGNDDAWVYIDNRIAVDLGGMHLPAPAYVNLDKFVGASGSWTVGGYYDIDIYSCSRRTTMSTFHINTNMYLEGTTSACGSSADVPTSCENASYTLVTQGGTVVKTAEELAESKVYFGGIDLTNRCNPKIDKKQLTDLAPEAYYLVYNSNGKSTKIPFEISGGVDVVTKPAKAQDEDGNVIPGDYEFVSSAMGSASADNPSRIPVYISIPKDLDDSMLLDVDLAANRSYSLEIKNADGSGNANVTLEYRDADGELVPWDGKTRLEIGADGVDTVYLSMPLELLTESVQSFKVSVAGSENATEVSFFAPKMVFVEDATSLVPVTGDPDDVERWAGTTYNFYLLALAPSLTTPGQYEPCKSCNFALAVDSNTSDGLVVDSAGLKLVNGRAVISMASQKKFLVGEDTAVLSIAGPASSIVASYSPLHFREAPVSYPLFADIFDVCGKKPTTDLNIDDPYFSMEQEYLDGIPDSLVIYYNRPFRNTPDSLPKRLVVFWGEDSVVVKRDQFLDNMVCGAAAGLDDDFCYPRIIVSGVEFSKEVKTASERATVESYATFMDRGKKMEEAFLTNINDRVAPVIMSASLVEIAPDTNKLVLELSEDVKLTNVDYAKKAFSFFFNSAKKDKFKEGASSSAVSINENIVSVKFSGKQVSPQVGDFVRLRDDKLVWTDKAAPVLGTDESMRPEDDSSYNWNSPTAYNAEERLPSPWIVIEKKAPDIDNDDESAKKKPSFHIVLSGPFTFDIVFVDAEPGKTKSYAVMDLMGGVVKQGKTVGGTRISVKNSGSYIVRVGRGYQKVDVK